MNSQHFQQFIFKFR